VREASDGSAALRELAGKDFDLAILDMRVPGMDGIELLARIRERKIQTTRDSWPKAAIGEMPQGHGIFSAMS
jgi:CheY-like chemotaxis protein